MDLPLKFSPFVVRFIRLDCLEDTTNRHDRFGTSESHILVNALFVKHSIDYHVKHLKEPPLATAWTIREAFIYIDNFPTGGTPCGQQHLAR